MVRASCILHVTLSAHQNLVQAVKRSVCLVKKCAQENLSLCSVGGLICLQKAALTQDECLVSTILSSFAGYVCLDDVDT